MGCDPQLVTLLVPFPPTGTLGCVWRYTGLLTWQGWGWGCIWLGEARV